MINRIYSLSAAAPDQLINPPASPSVAVEAASVYSLVLFSLSKSFITISGCTKPLINPLASPSVAAEAASVYSLVLFSLTGNIWLNNSASKLAICFAIYSR